MSPRPVGGYAGMITTVGIPQPQIITRISSRSTGIRAVAAVSSKSFFDLRRRAALNGCKWDT